MKEDERKLLADTLCAARKKKGYSQEKLGEILHLSRKAISEYETGRNLPPIDRLQDLFSVLQDETLLDVVMSILDYRKENNMDEVQKKIRSTKKAKRKSLVNDLFFQVDVDSNKHYVFGVDGIEEDRTIAFPFERVTVYLHYLDDDYEGEPIGHVTFIAAENALFEQMDSYSQGLYLSYEAASAFHNALEDEDVMDGFSESPSYFDECNDHNILHIDEFILQEKFRGYGLGAFMIAGAIEVAVAVLNWKDDIDNYVTAFNDVDEPEMADIVRKTLTAAGFEAQKTQDGSSFFNNEHWDIFCNGVWGIHPEKTIDRISDISKRKKPRRN